MGFFDKLKAAPKPADERVPRALLVPAVSAIMADGDMQGEEVAELSNLCSFSPVFHHIRPERLAEMVRELIAEVMERGGDTMLREAADALSPALRETAYCFVARIVLADGTLGSHEKMALERIEAVLGLDPAVAARIREVIGMMQRPA